VKWSNFGSEITATIRLRLVVLLVVGGYFYRRPTSETNKAKDISQPVVNVHQGPGLRGTLARFPDQLPFDQVVPLAVEFPVQS